MDNKPVRVGELVSDLSGASALDDRLAAMRRKLEPHLAWCTTLLGAPNIDGPYVKGYAYYLDQAGVTPDEADAAIKVHVRRSKFFPQPAEIIEIVKASRPTRVFVPVRPDEDVYVPSREERDAILAASGRCGKAVLEAEAAKVAFIDDPEDVARTERERREAIAKLKASKEG